MSNLSNIGFDIQSEEEFYALIEKAYEKSVPLQTKGWWKNKFTHLGYIIFFPAEAKNVGLVGLNRGFSGVGREKKNQTRW